MKRDTLIQLAALLIIVLCLGFSGGLSASIINSAGRNQLSFADTAEDGDPPEVALGIAMGAFRGIFVNILWYRANDMKEKGQYYEAMELARAITTLQPRFPQVWVFHAWNMAYNISVATNTPEERWQWVQSGLRLLRDEGIRANPNNMLLHKELAWIYLHKITGITDDSNQYYKRKLAEEWTIVLGPPPPRSAADRTRQGSIDRYANWLQSIADAPDTLDQLAEINPESAVLFEALAAITDGQTGYDILRRYETHKAMRTSIFRAQARTGMGARNIAFADLIDEPRFAEAWPHLLSHLRRRILIDTYNMEPERMIRYTKKYGPMDWRHGAAHALYWSARGVEESLTRWTMDSRSDYDFINTDRVTIQALQELYRSGDVYFNFFDSIAGEGSRAIQLAPNAAFVETYGNILEELISRSWADVDKRPYRVYSAGYENFLRDAVRFFYRRGQLEMAQHYYHALGTYPGQNTHNYYFQIDVEVPLDEFVLNELKEDRIRTPNVVISEVTGALQAAYVGGLLGNDDELFTTNFEWARQAHTYYYETQVRDVVAGAEGTRTGVLDPDFRIVAGDMFARTLQLMRVDEASGMYQRAPAPLQQFAYDFLFAAWKANIDEQLAAGVGEPFEILFPEPPGMDAHHDWLARVAAARRAKRVDLDRQ